MTPGREADREHLWDEGTIGMWAKMNNCHKLLGEAVMAALFVAAVLRILGPSGPTPVPVETEAGPAETDPGEREEPTGPLFEVGMDRYSGREAERHISEYVREVAADVDGDGEREHLCLRTAWVKTNGCKIPFHTLIVDLFKEGIWILRQELDLGVLWEEQFFLVKDLDGDGEAELITRIQMSPGCSGCVAHRIYAYDGRAFVEWLNLFGVSPHLPQVARVLRNYNSILDHIESRYKIEISRKKPGGHGDEEGGSGASAPWLLDSDGDGQVEIIQLLHPTAGEYSLDSRVYRLLVMELPAKGIRGRHRFYPLKFDGPGGHLSLLGFLKTRDARIHALFNFAYLGTATGYPILNIFEVKGVEVKRIAELYGFYEHVVPERLWDVNQDGNTEIIHVGSSYWPPGKSHAEIILGYEIMEYKNGKYLPAGPEIEEMAVLGNGEEEDD